MRKTRLVILPTKCLHQMGFLLLFLSCPVIGDWGRIRPETENAHIAIQRSREGTCGLQRDPSGGLLSLWRKNLSNQCLKNANVEGYDFKPMLSTVSDVRVRENLIRLERKDIGNQQRRETRMLESRRQNVDQQRRTLRTTEKSQDRKSLNDRQSVNRMSVRNNNADFRRLSLGRIQSLERAGVRNEVLRRSSVRLHRNEPERQLKNTIPKNSSTRSELRSDRMSRRRDERLQTRRNDMNDIRRQNDRTQSERIETRRLSRRETINREATEESMRIDRRQPEARNNRQNINAEFSRRTSERESRVPIRSEERRRDVSTTTRRLMVRKDSEMTSRRTESKSRRFPSRINTEDNIRQDTRETRREETTRNQRTSDIRRSLSDISVLQNDRRDASQARLRNIHGLNEKIISSVVTKATTDRNVRTDRNDARRNMIFASNLRWEKRGKDNVRAAQQLRDSLTEEKSENFMDGLLKWTSLNGYDTPKVKDWIGNCFIGAAAYYLTSRQVKVV